MKVYVVEFAPDYEPSYVVGVYSSQELAERVVEKQQPNFYYTQPCITEYELDEVPKD